MAITLKCRTPSQISQYVSGRGLTRKALRAYELHILNCAKCSEAVARYVKRRRERESKRSK